MWVKPTSAVLQIKTEMLRLLIHLIKINLMYVNIDVRSL